MTMNRACEHCEFWIEAKGAAMKGGVLRVGYRMGECRRFPPIPVEGGVQHPATKPQHWCGEFQVKAMQDSVPPAESNPNV